MSGYLANENFPLEAIRLLRADGVEIVSATESYRGWNDIDILKESVKLEKVLITFDKDFGDYVFYYDRLRPVGVVLLRFKPRSAGHVYEVVSDLMKKKFDFVGHFSVVTERKIRMIPL